MRLLFVFCGFFVGMMILTPASTTLAAPCSCAWDNSSKSYPPNSRNEGMFSTTVHYQCGYLCLDQNSTPQMVSGEHSVTFSGSEAGNEVICDGLRYESQPNPSGSFGRWSLFVWDGLTRLFDARQSTSPSLRQWGKGHCDAGEVSTSTGIASLAQINDWRATVGLKPLRPHNTNPQIAQAASLDSDFFQICQPDERQKSFVQGQTSKLPAKTCEGNVNEHFESLRQKSFQLREPKDSAQIMSKMDDLLLCPSFVTAPSPAILRTILEKFTQLTRRDASLRASFQSMACTMAWRGLRWNLITPLSRQLLSVPLSPPDKN